MSTIVHDADYVAWVQRSMNRLMLAGLKTDGKITQFYRLWVNEFQIFTKCSTIGGQVDKNTQDYIIAINNVDTNNSSRLYINWVQHCLIRLKMGDKIVPTGQMTKETKNAIKAFQNSVKHKNVDGVVGPKTEKDLAKKVPDFIIPGFYTGHQSPSPYPVDPVQELKDGWLESHTDTRGIDQRIDSWINMYIQELTHYPGNIINPLERQITMCMLKKLSTRTGNYEYITQQMARSYAIGEYINKTPYSCTSNAVDFLRAKVGKFNVTLPSGAKYRAFKSGINSLYRDIDNGIKEIFYQYNNASGVHKGTYGKLVDWHTDQHSKPWSLISCIPL